MSEHLTAPLDERDRAAAAAVATLLAGRAPVGVAFSGGVDSSVLLALAARSLGRQHVLALLGVSPSLAADERTAAHEVAAYLDVRLIEVETHEAQRDAYVRNGPDRCFECRDELFTRIADDVVEQHGLASVAYGENADDAVRSDRPGALAATAHEVLRPLADAGMRKDQVRRIARALGLPSADRPAAPCLASRIPHFEAVLPDKLRQIEAAEAALRRLGFDELRVRHHGEVARIELPHGDLVRAVQEPLRSQIQTAVNEAGFRFVALDITGIRSGAFTLPLIGVSGG